MKLINIVG